MLTKKGTEQNLSSPARASIALLLAALVVGAYFFFNRALTPYKESVSVRLGRAISQDLQSLKAKSSLPEQFNKVRGFELSTEGSTFKPWVDETKISFPTDPNGTFELQLFIFFFVNENRYGANVQYDLVDSKTKNTVWELTRSYNLGWIF